MPDFKLWSSQSHYLKAHGYKKLNMQKNIKKNGENHITGIKAGILLCHGCHKTIAAVGKNGMTTRLCPRCGASIHFRKPDSIVRTWALLITAAILVFPANLLPIMRVYSMSVPDDSTIMEGIIYFFKEGSYGIGLIIFTASILIPLFKITGIGLILFSIHFKWKAKVKQRALMFRFIQFVGRWSMLDIFVIALLQAFIDFGILSSTVPAPAATYFTGVVVTTMFAAITFDPRLMWDEYQKQGG